MTMPQDVAGLHKRMKEAVKANWKAFLIEGIVLVILGMAAIAIPLLASIAVTIFLGWLFLISGAVGLYLTFTTRDMPGFWWSLLSAVLALAAGIILIVQPVAGTLTLTLVVSAYFIAEGITTIMYALAHRSELSGRWGWLLVSGIVDLVVAALIIAGLPGSAAWAIGLLVGINLVFGGTSLIGMALAARKA
ncbi:HdeD family acid-resistance protein [Afipia massiliensis]|uniref:HdeD family acid-resistance protein n=1 Tax=Afipia massiliensis TaxID=211460 RepID=A0A4U6BT64_9BRAD|nr:HdeD family acid-resistance protein [Afipia massiliensis]TKT73181.1 HdeD family acid-resistance protein [Afipia massiliensis]